MKIAHVTATFPPYWAGTGNVAYHNARLLHERGHEVTVFTAATPRDAEMSFEFRVERLAARLQFGNAPLTPQLLGKLRGFDVIHLHYPYIFGAELSLLAALRWRTPLVLTYHNQLQETQPLKRALFSVYNLTSERLLLHLSNRLVAVNEEHLTSRHPHLLASPRVAEVTNGVDTRLFRPTDRHVKRDELGVSAATPVVLFVGALDQAHRFKNVDGLIRAFAALKDSAAELWVIGDGDLRGGLEHLTHRLGCAERVRFLGRFSPDALPPYFSAADVSVLPSTGVESFGMVLIESLACATPVIASNLPGVRQVVAHGQDGYLVPVGDERALTDTLDDVLRQPDKARQLGCAGREKVAARYDWQVVGDGLEHLYRQVLGQRV